MTDHTPTPAPQTPDTADASAHTTADATTPRRRGSRKWLIGGGAAVAALVLAGGGVAVGAAIADDDDDRDDIALAAGQDRDAGADRDAGDDRRDDAAGSGGAGGSAAASVTGSASADELIAVADAARAAAEGEVVSIDAERDGAWEVHLETAAGDEAEVRVAADGTATVTSTDVADGDDTGPTTVLDSATIESLVTAALAEADGTIVELSTDDRDDRPYDVTVLTGDRRTVDIDVDSSFTVVATDLDDESDDD